MSKIKVPDTPLSSSDVNPDTITKERLTILWTIALWYNGVGIQHGSNLYHISKTKPPSLQTLLGCSDDEWDNTYKLAFEFLSEQDVVTEMTILRRKVRWAPTETFLKVNAELFADHLERIVVPDSAFNSGKGHIGDPLESLPHRTAVEQTLSWLTAAGYCWRLYPGQPGDPRPDIHGIPQHSIHQDTILDSEIEVISDHNNKEMYVKKYAMFTEQSGKSTWIFENRAAAAKAINMLSETTLSGYLENRNPPCDIANTPLRHPENYALKTLNSYLKQSRENPQLACPGMDYVQTITGIYESCDGNPTRRPATVWNTNTDEIEVLGPMNRTVSITLEELNDGAELRMGKSSPSRILPD